MLRKIGILLLSFVMVSTTSIATLNLINTVGAENNAVFEYYVSDGAVRIERYLGPGGDLIIPATIDGKPVTEIGSNAFQHKDITSVVIPDSVITIWSGAFSACHNLTAVVLGKKVSSIYGSAFSNCPALTTINIPESVTTITNYAFVNCISLRSITLPNNLTILGEGAFEGTALTSVIIPNKITTIENNLFAHCGHLKSISIQEGITSIGSHAFEGCNLTSVAIPKSVKIVKEYAFNQCSNMSSLTFSEGVTTIEDQAFAFCVALTTVTFPGTLITIGLKAFFNCTSLGDVNIPSLVQDYGDGAFANCISMTSIGVDTNNQYFKSVDGVVYFKNLTTLVECPSGRAGDFVVPVGTKAIMNGSFMYCGNLTSINIPDSVRTIGTAAFMYAVRLPSVVMPDSVEKVGEFAFAYCLSLKTVTVSSKAATLGNDCFYSCVALRTILFNGNAPSTGVNWGILTNRYLTLYYHQGANGFSTPTWEGLPCYPLDSRPIAPEGLSYSVGNGQVDLTWNVPSYIGNTSIDYYVVYQNYVDVKHVPGTSTTITGLKNDVMYTFEVAAHNSGGIGPNSSIVYPRPTSTVSVPGVPTGLSVSAGNALAIVSWSGPSINGGASITEFKIFRGTSSSSMEVVATVGLSTTSYTDTSLTNGVRYYYGVAATNSAGLGTMTEVISVLPSATSNLTTSPGPVTDILVTKGNGKITLDWSAPSSGGAASYILIYRANNNSQPTSPLVNLSSGVVQYVDSDVDGNATYYYWIVPVNSVGPAVASSSGSIETSKSSASADNALLYVVIVGAISLVGIAGMVIFKRKRKLT